MLLFRLTYKAWFVYARCVVVVTRRRARNPRGKVISQDKALTWAEIPSELQLVRGRAALGRLIEPAVQRYIHLLLAQHTAWYQVSTKVASPVVGVIRTDNCAIKALTSKATLQQRSLPFLSWSQMARFNVLSWLNTKAFAFKSAPDQAASWTLAIFSVLKRSSPFRDT